MKIQIVGSSTGEGEPRQFLSTYLIDETIAIDAGSVGFMLPIEAQTRINHVFISHSHLDHIASLPIFLDNRAARESPPFQLFGSEPVLESLRRHLFNNEIWPDLEAIKPDGQAGFEARVLESNAVVQVDQLRVTPIELNHAVPTMGFVIEDDASSVAFVSDTTATDEVWNRINQLENLKAVFVECAFPNSQQALADVSKHLTPQSLSRELTKLSHAARVIVVHMKPAFHETIHEQLAALDEQNLEFGVVGQIYEL